MHHRLAAEEKYDYYLCASFEKPMHLSLDDFPFSLQKKEQKFIDGRDRSKKSCQYFLRELFIRFHSF